jgi:hypothetical protein
VQVGDVAIGGAKSAGITNAVSAHWLWKPAWVACARKLLARNPSNIREAQAVFLKTIEVAQHQAHDVGVARRDKFRSPPVRSWPCDRTA